MNWQKAGMRCLLWVLSLTIMESKPLWVHARFSLGLLLGPYIESGLAEGPLGRLTALDSRGFQPAFDPEARPPPTEGIL